MKEREETTKNRCLRGGTCEVQDRSYNPVAGNNLLHESLLIRERKEKRQVQEGKGSPMAKKEGALFSSEGGKDRRGRTVEQNLGPFFTTRRKGLGSRVAGSSASMSKTFVSRRAEGVGGSNFSPFP